jgi:ribosomal protein L28
MPRICEITRKKIPHLQNIAGEQKPDPKAYQRALLKRNIKVPEIKGSVNLKVSEEGLKLIKEAGGLSKFLKDRDDKKLSPRLLKLKRRIYGEPKPEKPAEEEAPAAAGTPPEEKPAEAAKAEEKPAEAAKAEEKPAEAAKSEEKPAEG